MEDSVYLLEGEGGGSPWRYEGTNHLEFIDRSVTAPHTQVCVKCVMRSEWKPRKSVSGRKSSEVEHFRWNLPIHIYDLLASRHLFFSFPEHWSAIFFSLSGTRSLSNRNLKWITKYKHFRDRITRDTFLRLYKEFGEGQWTFLADGVPLRLLVRFRSFPISRFSFV